MSCQKVSYTEVGTRIYTDKKLHVHLLGGDAESRTGNGIRVKQAALASAACLSHCFYFLCDFLHTYPTKSTSGVSLDGAMCYMNPA